MTVTCKFGNPCPVLILGTHSTAQHILLAHGHKIKNVTHYEELVAAVDRDAAVQNGDEVVLSRDEALVLQKLLSGWVVGPSAQAVIDKLRTVKA
jgi:hypothetical protein